MADVTTMLSPRKPDPSTGAGGDDMRPKAAKAFMALHIVSAGAHAVRNIVMLPIADVQSDDASVQKTMKDLHVKWDDLTKKLDQAQRNADIWIGEDPAKPNLFTRVAQTIPNHILDYSATYDAASDEIIAILEQAKTSGSKADLVRQALELIGVLRDQVQGYQAEIAQVGAELRGYTAKVQADHDALLGGSDAIQTLISVEQTEVTNFKADIDRLHSEIDAYNKQITDAAIGVGLGIFVAVIGVTIAFVPGCEGAGIAVAAVGVAGVATGAAIWGTLEQKVKHCESEVVEDQATRSALTQQVIGLTALHASLENALRRVEEAQIALSDVNVFWNVFGTTLQHVIDDLNKPNPNLSIVLDEMWVRAAKNNWKDLTQFAQTLVSTGVTVETKKSLAAAA